MKIGGKLILLLILVVSPFLGFAQQYPESIRGIVSDKNGPLVGATVHLQDENQRILTGVVTGINGDYILFVPNDRENMTIVASYIGYDTTEESYKMQPTYNFRLEQSIASVGEVVVVGRAERRDAMDIKKDDLGVAVEMIELAELQDMSVTSVEEMVQGRLANVDIMGGGDPGTSASIRIRGSASLNASNEPLIVIDNIPQDFEVDDDFDFGGADIDDFGSLVSISPSDIQSIEVLKDAAATALWGPKAANGVLLITTKQGGNHKPVFTFSQKFNYSLEPKDIEVLNGPQYTTLMQDALWNWVKDGGYASDRVKKLTGQKDILYDQSYEYFDEFSTDTDWMDLITRKTMNYTTDFSMSGGGDKTSYRFSLGYEDQTGTTVGTDYARITSRLNLNYRFSKKLLVSSSFNYSESTRNEPYSGSGVAKNTRNMARDRMPNMSPYVIDEFGNVTDEYFTAPSTSIQGASDNPLSLVNESLNQTLNRTLGASFNATYSPFNGLRLVGNVALNMSTVNNEKFLPYTVSDLLWSHADYNKGIEGSTNKLSTYVNLRANYNKVFKRKHALNIGLSEQIQSISNNNSTITTAGSASGEVATPASGGKIVGMSSSESITRSIGLMGSVNYTFKNKYAFTFAARVDAKSNMSMDNRWRSPRPSASVVWKMEQEKFMKKFKWINQFRLRGSWGQSERSINSTAMYGTFATDTEYGEYGTIRPTRLQVNSLRPETVTQYNGGFSGQFFKNKITVDFEVYNKLTTDLLQTDYDIQSSTGFQNVRYFNSGSVSNKGWEFMFSYRDIFKIGKLKFSLNNFNISQNVNNILEIPDNLTDVSFNVSNGVYAPKLAENSPIGSIFGFLSEGVYQNVDETYARDKDNNYITDINGKRVITSINGTWQQRPGDAKYADINHDGVIDEYDVVYLGSSYPKLTGGASFRLQYSNLSLRMSFHFRLGQSIVNQTRLNLEKMSTGANQAATTLNRWRYEGDQTDIPRALWGTNYNTLGSDRFVEDGSFLKLKDVSLNYLIPAHLTKRIGIGRANVYLTAYNLLTVTNYSGQDPEVTVSASAGQKMATAIARDNSKTPPTTRFAAGISFNF